MPHFPFLSLSSGKVQTTVEPTTYFRAAAFKVSIGKFNDDGDREKNGRRADFILGPFVIGFWCQ